VPKDRRLDILTDGATLLESPQIEHRPLRADATSRGGIFVRSWWRWWIARWPT